MSGDPVYPPIENMLPPLPIGKSGELIAKAYEKLGWHWWPSYSAIISTKFADIFRLNSINIGLLPIEASQEDVEALFNKIENNPDTKIKISVGNKSVECEDISFSYDLDDFSQKRILEGIDKIDITLSYEDKIESFSNSRKSWKPKLA